MANLFFMGICRSTGGGDLLLAKSQLKLSKCLIKGQSNTNFILGRDLTERKTAMTPNFSGSQNHISSSTILLKCFFDKHTALEIHFATERIKIQTNSLQLKIYVQGIKIISVKKR